MAIRSHRRYFDDPDKRQCVDCHENVGDHRLGYDLEEMGWKKPEGDAP